MSKKPAATKQSTALALSTQNTILSSVVAAIQKKHGTDSIMFMTSTPGIIKHPRQLSSGSLTLDLILGPFFRKEDLSWQAGFVDGRIIEIYGPEAAGKSTLILSLIANTQKRGGIAALIDAEHTFDPNWARRMGVDLDKLIYCQPNSGEEALSIADDLVKSGAIELVAIDSVAALIPKRILEGEVGDQTMGMQAKMMSEALGRFTSINSKTIIVFTNQMRSKVGMVFGNPETTPGGNALKYYSSYRLDVRRGDALKEGEITVGFRMKVKLIKNKLSPPYQAAEFDFRFDLRPDWPAGIDKVAELFDIAVTSGVILANGSWYSMRGHTIGQGRSTVINGMRSNKQFLWDLFQEVMAKKLAERGYNVDLTPLPGMPSMPIAGVTFEAPTAEDLANSAGQEELLVEA